METSKLFLINQDDSKAEYKRIMEQTVNALTASITDDRAYAGPTPDELKKHV